MTISIIGCGWFGLAFGKALVEAGYKVKGATTTAEKIAAIRAEGIEPYLVQISAEQEHISDTSVFGCDVLVITIPPKVHLHGGEDYLFTQNRLIDLANEHRISKILFISSTSVYGDVGGQVDEDTTPAPDTLSGQILLKTERRYASIHSIKTTVIRFGGLFGPGRDPGRFFAGKENIANGLAPVNLIHLDDCIGIAMQVINSNFFGAVINACSPDHPTRKDFYTNASRVSGLAMPLFVDELVSWKIVNSKIVSDQLQYKYIYSQLTPGPSL